GIGLVPTMGALHEGHLALVARARQLCRRVTVSIFINPAQFAPGEDFASYPRDLEADCSKLKTVGADLVFAPSAHELYPEGFATRIEVGGPAEGLETDFRPHFFAGVATVVAKLLIAAKPDVAVFGEKDYQQLLVVRQLTKDLGLPVKIEGVPIVRERDGLALSSRNAYLSATERKIAGQLNAVLADSASRVRSGAPIAEIESGSADQLREAGFDEVDYVAVRDAQTLRPVSSIRGEARILAAARIGRTRLIDNMAVTSA
ncbi:MAG: pantoate--beta-alanine ligase, partial [Alphaproteobacteria bacterium]|nr:pantoate--beta-alanine ligase [Alphaproteobacteria bacterium]